MPLSDRDLNDRDLNDRDLNDSALNERDRAILEFEAEWHRHAGAKEEAIRADLGLSPARYYQLLGRLIDTTAAQEHDPMLVKRLRRIRDAREQARLARASGAPL